MLAFLKKRMLDFARYTKCASYVSLIGLGAISSFIFPPFEWAVWGYIALILSLALLFKTEKIDKKIFWRVYVFSFSFFAIGFSWICNALLIDEDSFVGFVPVVFIGVGAFFGLFVAVPAYLMKFGKNIYSRVVIFCCLIVFFEWVRSFLFTGFPWNLLGSALSFDARFIQGASVIGTYGLSLLLMLFLSGISLFLLGFWHKKVYKFGIVLLLLPLLGVIIFSFRYKEFEDSDFKVRLVQPSIKQTFKWNKKLLYSNFRSYIDLSKSKPLDGIKLVVWGETASPYPLDFEPRYLNEVGEAIGKDGFLATGLIRYSIENGEYVPYNSLFVIDDNKNIRDYYDKVHLVPFGEFLPFRKYLPEFMKPVANVVGNLGRGEKYKNLRVTGLPLMGGAICYESIFPKEVINPKEKPEILLVVANDGWYGNSFGPYQHLVATQLRAVEEGISVIRSANTGISAVIKPNGDVVGKIGLNEVGISDVLLPKVLSVDTVYGRYGNLILFFMLIIGLLVAVVLNIKK